MVLNENSTVFVFPFFLKNGMTGRVPVKGNCVDSGSTAQLSGRNFIEIAS